ncbi:MAG: hypothetical protein PF489_14330 [Salinivirgaceae bacterium]|nr:hypothetical protein [Salinivirgaceae bacterium]
MNSVRLLPNDQIVFNGFAKNEIGTSHFTISLLYIAKEQVLSHAVAKLETIKKIPISTDITSLHNDFVIPDFDTEKLVVQPVVYFGTNDADEVKIDLSGLTLSIPNNKLNRKVYTDLSESFNHQSPAIDKQL